jgi:hypothetical protein
VRFAATISHGVITHFDTMGVVNRPVQNAVGQRGIADLFWQRETALQRSSAMTLAPPAVSGRLRPLSVSSCNPQSITAVAIASTGHTKNSNCAMGAMKRN